MNRLTMSAARTVEAEFEGRISSAAEEPHPEMRGVSRVLYPESTADVERAVRLIRAADRRMFVKSGFDVSTADVGDAAVALAAPSIRGVRGGSRAAVLSMSAFAGVDVDGLRVAVGPAATVADVATAIVGTAVFLPLDDGPSQTMASLLLGMATTPFVRSAPDLGTLRDAVVEVEAVPIEGDDAGVVTTLRQDALQQVWSGNLKAVITRAVFDTSPWQTLEAQRWTLGWMMPYKRESFGALCDLMFGTPSALPPGVDVTLRVSSAALAMVLVVLRATGRGEADRLATETAILEMLGRARCTVLDSLQANGPGSSIAAWVTLGAGGGTPAGELPTRIDALSARSFVSIRNQFLEAIDLAVGVEPDGREHAAGVRAWAELQLMPGGQVGTRGQVAIAKAVGNAGMQVQARLTEALSGQDNSPAAAVVRGMTTRAPGVFALLGVEPLPDVETTLGFDLAVTNRAGTAVIPGFAGDIFLKSEGKRDYRRAVMQYASSSYQEQTLNARMRPRLVAVPVDAADIVRAVQFAVSEGLKIVARSGGHQYCGLSSGGDDTLVLDMRRFDAIRFSTGAEGGSRVTVGPGVRLHRLSTELKGARVAVPHGECPLVNIGGHVQTGGVGHQLRSLGLTVDWVSSFRMVTARPDGAGGHVYEEREFTRPRPASPSSDDDVFKAVLGGSPGSWGVITEVTFDLLDDSEFPMSHGYSRTYLYCRPGLHAAMEQIRRWAIEVAAGRLPEGVDLFVTAISGEFSVLRPQSLVRPSALLVEVMCTDAAQEPRIREVIDAVEEALPFPFDGRLSKTVDGRTAMSAIAAAGVREIGLFGMPASGREFDLPFRKSLYVTRVPFSEAFRDRFVDLVDRVKEQGGVEVVVQAVVGGGRFGGNGHAASHMQRRDAVVQLVFDVFYERGHEPDAEQFQTEMKDLLQEFSGGEALRMFWGTFEDAGTDGAQLDMSRPEVQALYFDSAAVYARLQVVKARTDPDGVFGTGFGVRPPS